MNPDQCQRILKEMEATWPKGERNAWTDEQVVVWLKTLAPFDFADALAALDACREACRWQPSHAEFREHVAVVLRARAEHDQQERRALMDSSPGIASDATRKRWFATMREQLAGAKGPLARDLREEFKR